MYKQPLVAVPITLYNHLICLSLETKQTHIHIFNKCKSVVAIEMTKKKKIAINICPQHKNKQTKKYNIGELLGNVLLINTQWFY